MFWKITGEKKVVAIPFENDQVENYYRSLFSGDLTDEQIKDLENKSTQVIPPGIRDSIPLTNSFFPHVISPDNKTGMSDFNCGFRFCPLCSKSGSFFNVFYYDWWKKLQDKPLNFQALTHFISKLKYVDLEFSKELDKIITIKRKNVINLVWSEVIKKQSSYL